jgi:cyclic beta-1,2-glucan synthetase
MASLERHLIRREERLALLFTPPFDRTSRDPGYIKGYPPGLVENGGQYSHAAMWTILAFAKLGSGTRAADLFALLNPINPTPRTPSAPSRLQGRALCRRRRRLFRPAATQGAGVDLVQRAPAAWMYRAGVEGILGIPPRGRLSRRRSPHPRRLAGIHGHAGRAQPPTTPSRSRNPSHTGRNVSHALLDGSPVECSEGHVRLPLDGAKHRLFDPPR